MVQRRKRLSFMANLLEVGLLLIWQPAYHVYELELENTARRTDGRAGRRQAA